MPDSDGARRDDDPRDAGEADRGKREPRKDGTGPKAVPLPSLASRDMPVPRPVRPASPGEGVPRATPVPSRASRDSPVPRPVRRASPAGGVPGATPVPSGASRDSPVPRPVRPASPAGGVPRATPVPGKPVRGESGTIFDDAARVPPAGPPAADAEPERPRTSFSSVKKTTRPGSTQAMRIGPESDRKQRFTRHLIRSEDRVTIRDDIAVAYRFLASSGPGLYPDAHHGRLADISLTGAQIEGLLPAEPQKRDLLSGAVVMRLKAALPYVEEPLVVDAQVTWVKPSEGGASLVGLKFAGLTQQQSNLIRAFFIGLQSPARTKFHRGRPEGPA